VVLEEDGRLDVSAVNKRLPARELALDIGNREGNRNERVSQRLS
jgi:hypothetical protein